MKVNMTPNPLDVVTIHASQGDTEARQWEFELHNNGELIDTSNVTEQMFFKSYKGGTEQLLPENGSVPTTSPFKGDIKYPQGLLSDQEFTYRQSPTEEDGYAKIETIYGNTLVWNQLVQNGNFADGTNNWVAQNGTISASNGVLTYEVTTVGTSTTSNRFYNSTPLYVDHTYLCLGEFKSTKADTIVTARRTTTSNVIFRIDMPNANTWYKASGIATMNANGSNLTITFNNVSSIGEVGDKIDARNIMLFDLTQMGLDISDPSDFTSLFSLPYYSYNQGSLLSFNGTGIKTTGKNLINVDEWLTSRGATYTKEGNKYTITGNQTILFNTPLSIFDGIPRRYSVRAKIKSVGGTSPRIDLLNNGTVVSTISQEVPQRENSYIDQIRLNWSQFGNGIEIEDFQIEFGSVSTEYEPYTSSTLSLPISTYFPNGMKSVGNVYDEINQSQVITRIWGYTITGNEQTVAWGNTSYGGHYGGSISVQLPSIYVGGSIQGIAGQGYTVAFANNDKTIYSNGNNRISIINDAYTTEESWKNSLVGLTMYFVLQTPTETPITTASLVTENAEIPLSNDDGVLIGKCTEQLSENPGFFDAKIKLSDSDGECYSNKLQLHVERSPQ